MAFARCKSDDLIEPQPDTDAVDEAGKIVIAIGFAGKVDLRWSIIVRRQHRQAHHLEAETGIEFVAEDIEFLGEEFADQPRRTQRPARADHCPANYPIDPIQRQLELAAADAALFQPFRQGGGQ